LGGYRWSFLKSFLSLWDDIGGSLKSSPSPWEGEDIGGGGNSPPILPLPLGAARTKVGVTSLSSLWISTP